MQRLGGLFSSISSVISGTGRALASAARATTGFLLGSNVEPDDFQPSTMDREMQQQDRDDAGDIQQMDDSPEDLLDDFTPIDNAEFNDLLAAEEYQSIFDLRVQNTILSQRQAERLYDRVSSVSGQPVLTVTAQDSVDRSRTITGRYRDNFIALMTGEFTEMSGGGGISSDANYDVSNEELVDIQFENVATGKGSRPRRAQTSAAFYYVNETDLNLSMYQVFNRRQLNEATTFSRANPQPEHMCKSDRQISERLLQLEMKIKYDDFYNEQCVVFSLARLGVRPGLLNNIRLSLGGAKFLTKKTTPKICEIIGHPITIHSLGMDKTVKLDLRVRENKYGLKEKGKTLHLALFKNHTFVFERTPYSEFYIKHYGELREKEDGMEYNTIRGDQFEKRERSSTRTPQRINSLRLMQLLDRGGYFQKGDIPFVKAIKENDNTGEIYLTEESIEQECRLYTKPKRKELDKDVKIFFADCETIVTDKTGHKLLYIACCGMDDDFVKVFDITKYRYKNQEYLIMVDFFNYMTSNRRYDIICYFHNLKYDISVLSPYMQNIRSVCEKDRTYYSVHAMHYGSKIQLRDSYKMISSPLRDFGTIFNLPKKYCKMDIIAYEYYTFENVNEYADIKTYMDMLEYKVQRDFLQYISDDPIGLNEDLYEVIKKLEKERYTFLPSILYKKYLENDVICLKKGMLQFEKEMLASTISKDPETGMEEGLSIFNYLTIASVADAYYGLNGAYDGCCEMKGNLRDFVGRAVFGGRVLVNPKYSHQIIQGPNSDFDGVSLYPSAEDRMCRMKEYNMDKPMGCVKGLPKLLQPNQFHQWESFDQVFVEIKITKINKFQQLPLIAEKKALIDKDGTGILKPSMTTRYSNELPTQNLIVDKITLQDYIQFQGIEFDIIRGIYFNEGSNVSLGPLVQKICKERTRVRYVNPVMGDCLKLIANSGYGKLCIKKTYSEKKFVSQKRRNAFICDYFQVIQHFFRLNENQLCFQIDKFDDSYNRCHLGATVLSYSKRIMNEVFDIANRLGIPIFYQDTDSMHLRTKDIKPLSDEFRRIYGRELIGKDLGQFHDDFKLKGAKGDITAALTLIIGRKSYADLLESVDADGNLIQGGHFKLKGITEEGLHVKSKEMFKHLDLPLYGKVFEMYKHLATEKPVTFPMNPYNEDENKTKVGFDMKDLKVKTRMLFKRTVKFPKDQNKVEDLQDTYA